MPNIPRFGGASDFTISAFGSGETTSASGVLTVNSGLVGAKKKALVTGYIVGANTNTPTLTCTFFGSNDGTNFTQIDTALSIQKTNASVTAGRINFKEFDATGYTYFRVVTNAPANTFGYGVSMSLM